MRWEILVSGKYYMSALMPSLKEVLIKLYAIPVNMHHRSTATKQPKDKDKILSENISGTGQ